MRRFCRQSHVILFFGLALLAVSACGEREGARSHEEIIRADLTEILALQGSSCGEVISYSAGERMNYLLVCENGEAYRVRVSPEGQVGVKKHAGEGARLQSDQG